MRPKGRVIALAAVLVAMLAAGGCDSDVGTSPYPAPTDFAIQGIDVSKYQGDVDWTAVANSGVRFAYIKATEGGDYLDEKFRQNWELSRASGIARGAYHFAYWCRPAQEQAAWFLANVPNDRAPCRRSSTSSGIRSRAPARTSCRASRRWR
ncbi:Glycoside hydrolase family 25 (fragment) [Beijerinckiaceae bacterium RH AL1]